MTPRKSYCPVCKSEMQKGDPDVGNGRADRWYCDGEDCGRVFEMGEVDQWTPDRGDYLTRELVEVEL